MAYCILIQIRWSNWVRPGRLPKTSIGYTNLGFMDLPQPKSHPNHPIGLKYQLNHSHLSPERKSQNIVQNHTRPLRNRLFAGLRTTQASHSPKMKGSIVTFVSPYWKIIHSWEGPPETSASSSKTIYRYKTQTMFKHVIPF